MSRNAKSYDGKNNETATHSLHRFLCNFDGFAKFLKFEGLRKKSLNDRKIPRKSEYVFSDPLNRLLTHLSSFCK